MGSRIVDALSYSLVMLRLFDVPLHSLPVTSSQAFHSNVSTDLPSVL